MYKVRLVSPIIKSTNLGTLKSEISEIILRDINIVEMGMLAEIDAKNPNNGTKVLIAYLIMANQNLLTKKDVESMSSTNLTTLSDAFNNIITGKAV